MTTFPPDEANAAYQSEPQDWRHCNDCNRATDPDDAAPSCGAHVLCVSCYTTSDFRCRECQLVQAEEKVAGAIDWFAAIREATNVVPGLAPYVEPTPPAPLDLRHIDPVSLSRAMSIHSCSNPNCGQGIHVGHPVVSYRPVRTHHFTLYFHESCVILHD